MIDWLTLRLEAKDCLYWGGWTRLRSWGDRILRYCPASGAVRWETAAWDSVRSDSHQLAIRADGSTLHVQGSPARVMGTGDTVFGAGDAGRDIVMCARSMLRFTSRLIHYGPLPEYRLWRVSRTDVTQNYRLSNLPSVRVALAELRNVEGGRYRVSQQSGDTVYWSHQSRLRAGKAYAKGPHLAYMMSKSGYSGVVYSQDDLQKADSLLRLELRLGREWFRREKPWYRLTWAELLAQHEQYFGRMVGVEQVEVTDMGLVDKMVAVAKTPGQGKAAARTWTMIQSIGWQATRDVMPKTTWYRHLQIMRDAGLGDADISAGRVASIRKPLILNPVSSWEELRRVA